jgi:hypothetical protein
MCSRGCQLQARDNYKDYLAQNQETNFEYWKIPGLSVAIPALINVDKSGPNHLRFLSPLRGPGQRVPRTRPVQRPLALDGYVNSLPLSVAASGLPLDQPETLL